MSGGFSNPIIGGGGALVFPQIMSPDFDLANPSASPSPSWAILKSGLAYFFGIVLGGGSLTGPDYILNTSGFFIYNGTPASGNLIVSMAGAAGSDAFGNAYPEGFGVAAGTIPGGLINAGTIGTTQLANLAVNAAKIANNTITTSQIAAAAGILGSQIAAATIGGSNIQAATITASNIAANTITAAQIAAATITSGQIAAGTITGSNIAAGTITASNILANTITAAQIAAGTITATQIAAYAIDAGLVAAGAIDAHSFSQFGDKLGGGVFAYSSTPGPLNTDPYFLSGISTWSASNGAAISYSGLNTFQSPGSMLMTPDGTHIFPATSQTTAATAGTKYGVTCLVVSPQGWSGGGNGLHLSIDWKNSGGGTISTINTAAVACPAGQQVQIVLTGTAPAGTVNARVTVEGNNTPPATTLFYIQQVVLGVNGTLVLSAAGASGTDQFGNSYPAGIGTQGADGPDAGVTMGTGSGNETGAAFAATGVISPGGGAGVEEGFLELQSPQWSGAADFMQFVLYGPKLSSAHSSQGALIYVDTGGASHFLFTGGQGGLALPLVEAGMTAVAPGTGDTTLAAETWHTVSSGFPTGWSGSIRYRITPENEVELNTSGSGLATSAGATVANGTTLFTLPSGYRPAGTQSCLVASSVNSGTGQVPHFSIATTGAVSIWGLAVSSAITVAGRFPLN